MEYAVKANAAMVESIAVVNITVVHNLAVTVIVVMPQKPVVAARNAAS